MRNTLNKSIKRYQHMYKGPKSIAEYVWIDGTGINMRSKARILEKAPGTLSDLPSWQYDGSSTYQAETNNSEVQLRPVAMYQDPFRLGDNFLVLCDTYTWQDKEHTRRKPANTNFRHFAEKILNKIPEKEPWFAIEQEYGLMEFNSHLIKKPLGWPENGYPYGQGPYYCSVGAETYVGRDIAEAHMQACLYAGVAFSGINGEVMPGQLEYQIGAVEGIKCCDDVWISRYILKKIAEDYNVSVTFEPKIFPDWNGAGTHTNFSTKEMRQKGGLKYVIDACEKLGQNHKKHIELYGRRNDQRLTGAHETAAMDSFSWGYGDRTASLRLPATAQADDMGYIEDRRPASNMDPYVVIALLMDTCFFGNQTDDLVAHYKKWAKWEETQNFQFL